MYTEFKESPKQPESSPDTKYHLNSCWHEIPMQKKENC